MVDRGLDIMADLHSKTIPKLQSTGTKSNPEARSYMFLLDALAQIEF